MKKKDISYHKCAYIKVDKETFEMCKNELPIFSETSKQLALLYDTLRYPDNSIENKKAQKFLKQLLKNLDPDTGDVFIYYN